MLTKCPNPNCNSNLFEMVLGEPQRSRFKVWFVQCVACGVAINAMEYLSLGTMLNDVKERISALDNRLLSTQQTVQNIESMIRQIKK